MGGNKEGARKSMETRKKLYGEDHMRKIGALGGSKSKGRKLSAEHKRKVSEGLKKGRYGAGNTEE